MVSFAAGALFGDVFFHLLPEIVKENGFSLVISTFTLAGICLFFLTEKIVQWHHHHVPAIEDHHINTFSYMVLIGDGVHNFIDGIIIAGSYLISFPVGIATTIAVALHEIPQEIGDFGVLVHGGFSKMRALLFNFVTATTAIVGAVIALVASKYVENISLYIIPIAIGGFIYIAGSDLIPELHKHYSVKKSILQLLTFILGIVVMALFILLE